MEMVPAKLSPSEREYAKRAIAEYKTIRPIVQQGDLYRLISPYDGDKNFTSLMYVNEAKDKAVVFAYRHLIWRETPQPIIRLQGLKADAKYRIREVSPEFENNPVALNGKVISGKMLMQEGVVIPELSKWYKSNVELNDMRATNDWRSVVLELTEVE
jgi:alpha-galactosidase